MDEAVAAEGAFSGEADVFHRSLGTEVFATGDELDTLGSHVIEGGLNHGEFDDGVEVGTSVRCGDPGVADFERVIFVRDIVIA